MRKHLKVIMLGFVIVVWGICSSTSGRAYGAISTATMQELDRVNEKGPYLGIIVPNSFEMNPLLQSPSFVADLEVPYLDYFGITTQLLLILFKVKGVLHYGIAGNANPQLQIGDVTIPQYWAHTGLWNWQRYGDGPNDELALESNGDYTREIGYLRFADYQNASENGKPIVNFLNNVWYQPEEIFSADGIPEVRQHSFWVPVNKHYFKVAKRIEGMTFQGCVNSTCLPRAPKAVRVKSGASANAFVDNSAYREFLNSKFNITPIDMESAAVALVCHQQQIPFIAIRALSDLAGGGSAVSNEADIFASLAAQNAVDASLRFITLLFP